MLGLLPLALLGLVPASAGPAFGGAGGSVPPDPFAHPRFALSFLNDLPIGRSFANALVRRQEEGQKHQSDSDPRETPSMQADVGRHAGSDPTAEVDVSWFFGPGSVQSSYSTQRGELDGTSSSELTMRESNVQESLDAPAEHRALGGDGLPGVGNHTLQTFLLPPSRSYLCLLPPPEPVGTTSQPPSVPVEDDEPAFDPDLPERLLRHLSESCLFVRAGWFTYSYCHNAEVRQFREKARGGWPPSAEAWIPVADEEYEDYILGRATVPPYGESFDSTTFDPATSFKSRPRPPRFDPRASSTGSPSSEAYDDDDDDDEEGHAARPIAPITLARGAGARYLTTRWGGGTTCDQTGDAREIEIQYHCSSRGTDALSLIKETSTCSYVLRLETPRLCGVPGFSGDWGKGEVGQVACREIMDDDEVQQRLALGSTETSKDRTPLPSWALLPPSGLKSPVGDQPVTPLQQQQHQQKEARTAEQEATQAKWLEILKGQTAVLNQPVEAAPAKDIADAAADAVPEQTAAQLFESAINELLRRALAIADGANGEGEDRAAAVRALERAGAELASRHAANTAGEAEQEVMDEDPATDPLAGLSGWLSQAIVDAHAKAAEGGVGQHDTFMVDLDLDQLDDDEFFALFPDGLAEGDEGNGLVYVTLEEDSEAEGGWSIQLVPATEEGEGDETPQARERSEAPRDEL